MKIMETEFHVTKKNYRIIKTKQKKRKVIKKKNKTVKII